MIVPKSLEKTVKKVLDGEYDVPELNPERPVILDIGANVGAFSVWAARRWPGAAIYSYEPNPETFELLSKNVSNICVNAAVWSRDGESFLYDGNANSAECSLFHDWRGKDSGHKVKTVAASSLHPCDILKVDTEGSESIILNGYLHLHTCKAVFLEWHSLYDRYHLGSKLLDLGFLCASDAAWAIDCGVMKMVRTKNFVQKLYYTSPPPELVCLKIS